MCWHLSWGKRINGVMCQGVRQAAGSACPLLMHIFCCCSSRHLNRRCLPACPPAPCPRTHALACRPELAATLREAHPVDRPHPGQERGGATAARQPGRRGGRGRRAAGSGGTWIPRGFSRGGGYGCCGEQEAGEGSGSTSCRPQLQQLLLLLLACLSQAGHAGAFGCAANPANPRLRICSYCLMLLPGAALLAAAGCRCQAGAGPPPHGGSPGTPGVCSRQDWQHALHARSAEGQGRPSASWPAQGCASLSNHQSQLY
jgi:hypothetical protein